MSMVTSTDVPQWSMTTSRGFVDWLVAQELVGFKTDEIRTSVWADPEALGRLCR
ncbi:MAG: hypothetical protein ACYC6N_14805 [Pirellulaceae bacterium]